VKRILAFDNDRVTFAYRDYKLHGVTPLADGARRHLVTRRKRRAALPLAAMALPS